MDQLPYFKLGFHGQSRLLGLRDPVDQRALFRIAWAATQADHTIATAVPPAIQVGSEDRLAIPAFLLKGAGKRMGIGILELWRNGIGGNS